MDGTAAQTPRGQLLLIVGSVITVIALISVCARLYTRYFISRQLWYDDLTAVAGLLATIAAHATQSINAVRYLSRPMAGAGSTIDYSDFLFNIWLNDIMYNVAMLFIKMTFLLQYFRIFRQVHTMWVAYIVAMVVIGCWCMAQIFMIIFSCQPVQGVWQALPNTKCWIPPNFGFINASGTIVTDLIVLFLPVPTLMNLKLRRSQKWGLIGIFGVGGIVPIISILRIPSLIFGEFPDFIIVSGCWSIAELGAGVITASLATIRLLVSRAVPTLNAGLGTHEMSRKTRRTTSNRQTSAGSQRDLFEEDDLEVPAGRTLSNDADIRKDSDHPRPESTSTESFSNGAATQFAVTTDSLHFGLPEHLRTGIKTRITSGSSRGKSMSTGGAEFLDTFGIRVERDWHISESAAPE